MTVQLEIVESKSIEFLQIAESLRRLGVIVSIQKIASPAIAGEPMSDDELERLVAQSRQQIADGQVLTTPELKEFLKAWRRRSA